MHSFQKKHLSLPSTLEVLSLFWQLRRALKRQNAKTAYAEPKGICWVLPPCMTIHPEAGKRESGHAFASKRQIPSVRPCEVGQESLYIERRYLTLCSWLIGIWQFQKTVVRQQSNNDVHGYVLCICLYSQALIGIVDISCKYTYRRGLRRCLSRLLSNARASMSEISSSTDSHAFLFIALILHTHQPRQESPIGNRIMHETTL